MIIFCEEDIRRPTQNILKNITTAKTKQISTFAEEIRCETE